jgi:hypothetical protein
LFLLLSFNSLLEHVLEHAFLSELLEQLEDKGDVVVAAPFILKAPFLLPLSLLQNSGLVCVDGGCDLGH